MIDHLDHIVLTTARTRECIDFYTRVLGMTLERFGEGRMALKFGAQKINLHEKGREFEPKATTPVPGALDLCFIASLPLAEVIARLAAAGIPLVEGAGHEDRGVLPYSLGVRPRPGREPRRDRRAGRLSRSHPAGSRRRRRR